MSLKILVVDQKLVGGYGRMNVSEKVREFLVLGTDLKLQLRVGVPNFFSLNQNFFQEVSRLFFSGPRLENFGRGKIGSWVGVGLCV